MERILVTGGAGFIGHHLINKLLLQRQYQLSVIDNFSTGRKEYLQSQDIGSMNNNAAPEIYEVNIINTDRILNIIKNEAPDTCVHLAAKTSGLDSGTDPYGTIDVNVKGTLNVLEACYRCGVKNFIFASSAAVYGQVEKVPISEDVPLRPVTVYGASKVSGEALVSSYQNARKIENTVSLRIFNVYGEGQSTAYAGVIKAFIERLSKGMPPIIYGSGTQTRDFISVHDVVDAVILATKWSDKKKTPSPPLSSVFNLGTGTQLSISDLAMKMIKLFGLELNPLYRDKISNEDIRESCADMGMSRKELRLDVVHNLEQSLNQLALKSFD
jgi:UDP-glucose 4-epimerase